MSSNFKNQKYRELEISIFVLSRPLQAVFLNSEYAIISGVKQIFVCLTISSIPDF
jgi:hypothetical protein